MRTRALAILFLPLACKGPTADRVAPAAISGAFEASASVALDAGARTASVVDASVVSPVAPMAADAQPAASVVQSPALLDGSARACRTLLGPVKLPLRVPPSLEVRGDKVEVLLNEDGRPHTLSVSGGPPASGAAPQGLETVEGSGAGGLSVPCVSAGERVFCPDRSGGVHRVTRGQNDDRVVASSRPSSRIAATSFGSGHVALGYLASRQTSEGWVSEAWLAIDDERPQRVSEDGSGATSLALAIRGSGLVVLMVDARTALTAMHARPVRYERALALGEDAVVFVGGPGDRRTRGAIAVPPGGGPAWAFLPIARDVGTFGLATVRVDEPPRVDEPVAWSIYPNGLDPAPIAAAWSTGREPTVWVARVRPKAAEPSSPRVLELGSLDHDGAFVARDIEPTTGNPTDAALAMDAHGTLWLGWVDSAGSWLTRIVCR